MRPTCLVLGLAAAAWSAVADPAPSPAAYHPRELIGGHDGFYGTADHKILCHTHGATVACSSLVLPVFAYSSASPCTKSGSQGLRPGFIRSER
jgi:hypothetical protein